MNHKSMQWLVAAFALFAIGCKERPVPSPITVNYWERKHEVVGIDLIKGVQTKPDYIATDISLVLRARVTSVKWLKPSASNPHSLSGAGLIHFSIEGGGEPRIVDMHFNEPLDHTQVGSEWELLFDHSKTAGSPLGFIDAIPLVK